MKNRLLVFILIVLLAAADMIVMPYVLIPKPADVKGLAVSDTTYDSLEITWKKSRNASKYCIYRKSESGEYKKIGESETPEFKDTGLVTGTEYSYKVEGVNFLKRSEKKSSVKGTPKLDTPKLSGNTDNGKIELSFKEIPGANGYRVFCDGKEQSDIKSGKEPDDDAGYKVKDDVITYTDNTAEAGKEHVYKVVAYRGKADSDQSNEIKLKLISAGTITASIDSVKETVTLTWDGDDTYTSYKLYNGKDLLTETDGKEYTFDAKECELDLHLVGFNGEKKSPETMQKFRVKKDAMGNKEALDAACAWAEKIADDNSFAYGTKGPANHSGCYFCGTQGKKQRRAKKLGITRSFAKTYCCNTYVTAAFAHGANDPYVYKICHGGSCMGFNVGHCDKNLCGKKGGYQNFKYLGHIPKDQLQKGDVLSSHHHAKLYLGDGRQAEAGGGWGPGSISTGKLSYSSDYGVYRYVGAGQGSVYKVEEVTETKSDKDSSATGNEENTD